MTTRTLDFPARRAAPVVPFVHAVTTGEIVARADFVDVACAVMRVLGPFGAIHLPGAHVAGSRLSALAQGLSVAQRLTGAWLVVIDRVDVALDVGARGAQLTSRSMRVAAARRIAPGLALGASVHGVPEGLAAAAAGADWLVAKELAAPGTVRAGPTTALAEALAAATPVPVVAIGGLLPGHCRALRLAGVHGVAVIRGIWDAPNAERAAGDYLSCYDHAGVA